MNSKMISPKEVVDAVISYYYQNQETIELAQVEGFVRQIIGWRNMSEEFIGKKCQIMPK